LVHDISWNNISNGTYSCPLPLKFLSSLCKVIYIDQPIGTGFSYGTVTVNSTQAAAPFIWKAFQILFESKLFSKFQSREQVLYHNRSILLPDDKHLGLFSRRRVTVVIMDQVSLPISTNRMRRFDLVISMAKSSLLVH
jgi:hypothetical protein